MAYTVLARKYRSRTFEEVIGQEPIATTLVNAIKVGRIHHGYLFTGTRGVGKTSMARILAKALNCLKYDAPTTTPCGECDVCRAIAEGQDVDVLEIDAASNTGVDNIRELRSNTAYRPARARYKVYIIDEVHMLSTGAFNALLKTLEEPPDHVKFILATTEIQKVPATIQSRCQRFNFRHIEPEAIARRLLDIARAEGAACEEAVAQRVARLAAGSMRDALSILDQLLSVSPQKIDMPVLDEVLPPPQHERLRTLLHHAAEGDVAAVLTEAEGILSAGHGLEVFCQEAIELLRTLLLVRVCGADAAMVDIPAGARDDYVKLSGRFEVSHYVQMIPMLEELRRNVRYSGAGRALTEALLVRFAHMRQWASIEQLLGRVPADAGGADEKKKEPPARPARKRS
jgi:DNA polymerase-3 subunit gamma/tau